ncbi:GOLPH3/VPS74 family protein [Streptomyces gilvosporeus]|uniref:GPP34 family phosphoprotein n=1 Tax=Streptomyces gilvosporeus TaxID=553510 RepID=A0A1V0TLP6_9ACTN|nr:GPP34 family phosphoprotein [Streptomyces gilvosporeus]ARF53849.1 GPP34 family phosphoprotein [Streptomyces gilvosporeus]
MTTPRDLLIIALDTAASRRLERGDLSLALAGAELLDLLSAQAITLDGEHIVPGYRPTLDDHLLDEAAAALVRQAPYESVDDWLWRRGRGLAASYLTALEADGQLTRQREGRRPFRTTRTVLTDSPARRQAAYRWSSEEPVLTALAHAVGIHDAQAANSPEHTLEHTPDPPDDVATVLAALHEALSHLEFERQRRALHDAAFDNIWRGD